jgi:5-methylcytosine-specific restriction endonuclease McrA
MAFSELTKHQAFVRSGGRCECKRRHAHHYGRCTSRISRATAHFHHITAQSVGGSDGLFNCEVLCVRCHQLTSSYGRR